MAAKSSRHKNSNVFKFKSFAERIDEINVDIYHRVQHVNEEDDDSSIKSYFYQCLEKWAQLNLTQIFKNFQREVRGIITLNQVLYEKDKLIKILLRYLVPDNYVALEPLLKILIAIVKDLRKEFYVYYKQVFKKLAALIKMHRSSVVEWSFQALAYMFKFLWRFIINDLEIVLRRLMPLFRHPKQYIQNFAVESFAFIGRKVRNQQVFLDVLVHRVQNNDNLGAIGCGKLLFEVVKGIDGQFHSCHETYIPLCFNSVHRYKMADIRKSFLLIFEETIKNIFKYIKIEYCDSYWTVVINTLEQTVANEDDPSCLLCYLNLLGHSVQLSRSRIPPSKSVNLIQLLLKTFTNNPNNVDIGFTLSQISTLLLNSEFLEIPMEFTTSLIRVNLALEDTDSYLYFVENTVDYMAFDTVILPHFLQFCQNENFSLMSLRILTSVILKKTPFVRSSFELDQIQSYTIDFRLTDDLRQQIFQLPDTTDAILKEFGNIICRLVFVSRLKFNADMLTQIIDLFINHIVKLTQFLNNIDDLSDINVFDTVKKLLFLLYLSLESLVRLNAPSNTLLNLKTCFMNCLPRFLGNYNFIGSLRVLDLYFSQIEEHLSESDGKVIWSDTIDNLKSPFHEVRLLTSHIFYLLSKKIESSIDEDKNIFEYCYLIESTKPTIATYRDQIFYLDKLELTKLPAQYQKNDNIKTYVMNYVLGTFYINFRLLWEPAMKVLHSYVTYTMNTCQLFWAVFFKQLRVAYENVKYPKKFFIHTFPKIQNYDNSVNDNDNDDNTDDDDDDTSEMLDIYINFYKICNRIDYANYMMLLWKALLGAASVAEKYHHDFVPFFFKFLDEDYYKNFSDMATKWNVLRRSRPDDMDIGDRKQIARDRKFPKKICDQYLIAQLKVLSKFSKIRKIDKSHRLYNLYLELLSNRSQNVQKIAFECLQTYKLPHVTPYVRHISNLIDEKRIRSELIKFKIDPESKKIRPEHRSELIPLIFRILQSKLLHKKKMKIKRKNNAQLKKLQILRFLAQCKQEELMSFVHIAFSLYNKYDVSEDNLVEKLTQKLDFSKFPAPKRLLASLSFLKMVQKQFSHKLDHNSLKHLLRILSVIGVILHIGITDYKHSIYKKYVKFFRSLRSICLKILNQFFTLFESYPWTSTEIDLIFQIFVWSTIDYFPLENLRTPTTLLKLFMTWSTNSKYFRLLMKSHPGDTHRYPLRFIINLLESKSNLSPTVVNSVMEIVENLLKSDQDVDDVSNDDGDHLRGCDILLPDLENILNYFHWRLESRRGVFNDKESYILSKCSGLLADDATCSQKMLNLLLPLVYKKAFAKRTSSYDDDDADEELVRMLVTVKNLIRNVDNGAHFLVTMSRLFSEFSGKSIRLLLCEVFASLAEKVCANGEEFRNEMVMLKGFLNGLNSWSDMALEKADSDQRLDTFRDIDNYVSSNEISYEFALYIIENCFHILKFEKFQVIRDLANDCLKKIIEMLFTKTKLKSYQKGYILNAVFFRRIMFALKSPENENLFEDSIHILGHLSHHGSHLHPILSGLNCLRAKCDSDIDFFEYISHLFMHHKAAALTKLVHSFKTFKKIRIHSKVLTHFLHPLVYSFLCNEKYAAKTNIVNPAIEIIGLIASLLNWDAYESLLRFYLSKLNPRYDAFQKQIIRIIVAVLDSFHFELKNIQIDKANLTDKHECEEENIEDDNNDDDADQDNEEFDKDNDNNLDEDTEKPEKSAKILISIQRGLLPHLMKSLAQLTVTDGSHKLIPNKSFENNHEVDLLKIPISLAVVKLLLKLPDEVLTANLPKVFIKMCTFLRSKFEPVRKIARTNLEKMMQSLGPKYLNLLLTEMFLFLNRGYQIHVLIFTIHAVVKSLKDCYQLGDMDQVLRTLLEICKLDIFGVQSEEKEIEQITRKVSEAKSTKSYDMLEIAAQFISEKCLVDFLLPIKSVLDTTHSYNAIEKVDRCFRRIVVGLLANKFISSPDLLIFSFGIVSKSIPDLILVEEQHHELTNEEKTQLLRVKSSDTFIIAKEPERNFCKSNRLKIAKNTNAPLLVEFGLRLCYFLLKRGKVRKDDSAVCLDPFVPIVFNCLRSNSVKLTNLSIQCTFWFIKLDVPALKQYMTAIVNQLFKILHKYAAAGLTKGENLSLVVSTFKVMSLVVREYHGFKISEDQLKLLLMYVEQDLYNFNRQATAFVLLKSIITRKLIVQELHDLMLKVAELSITSELAHVRLTSRQLFIHFLMDYPLGKKLKNYIDFYLKNLSYKLEVGRDSVIEMLLTIVKNFPNEVLKKYTGPIFITMGAQLVNDDKPKCRKKIATCIETMLINLPKPQRDVLFDILLVWFKEKLSHRRLAAQLCGIFVQIEKVEFRRYFDRLLPLLKRQFNERFLTSQREITAENANVIDDDNLMRDHLYYQLLLLLQKLLKFCPAFLEHSNDVSIISLQVKGLLCHSHEWVRLSSCQYFGFLLATIDFDQFQNRLLLSNPEETWTQTPGKYGGEFLNKNPKDDLLSLTLDFCDQLQPGVTKSNLAEQVIRNLVFVGRLVEKASLDSDENKLNFLWLIKRLRKIGRLEADLNNSIVIIRTEFFKWIAAMCQILDSTTIEKFAYNLLKPLIQESRSTLESHEDLQKLALEILDLFKKKLPLDSYSRTFNKIQTEIDKKRMERKRLRVQLSITNPELAARKRAKLQKKKSDLRKRKSFMTYGGKSKKLKTE